MKPIKTYSSNYYLHKLFPLLFGAGFFGSSLYGLFNPDKFTVRHNNQIVETNFQNLLPFLIFGGLSLIGFIWISRNYFKIVMDETGITVLRINGRTHYKWTDLETIKGVALWNGTIFKAKPKVGKRFYFHADRPRMNLADIFKGKFRTQMSEYIALKKDRFGI